MAAISIMNERAVPTVSPGLLNVWPVGGYRPVSAPVAAMGRWSTNRQTLTCVTRWFSSEGTGEVVLSRIRPCNKPAGRLSPQAIEGIYSLRF
jgi:hypothetical protein